MTPCRVSALTQLFYKMFNLELNVIKKPVSIKHCYCYQSKNVNFVQKKNGIQEKSIKTEINFISKTKQI